MLVARQLLPCIHYCLVLDLATALGTLTFRQIRQIRGKWVITFTGVIGCGFIRVIYTHYVAECCGQAPTS